MSRAEAPRDGIAEAARQLETAARAKKCWTCGCLQNSVSAIERALPEGERPPELARALASARARFQAVEYECLGCPVCYPALAINALTGALGEERFEVADSCPAESVAERAGWPPLPGAYDVLQYRAPVAVCTLNDESLRGAIAAAAPPEVALVGTLHTENLGIERLVLNIVSNPHIRSLLLCASDSQQAIGHLPGQSLLALAREGLDARGRILGARGKRPVLKNVSREVIEHFRASVSVVDLVGGTELREILAASKRLASESPGPAEPLAAMRRVETLLGYLPKRMLPDPAGYFVLYIDRPRALLSLEHYGKDGVLDVVIDGRSAAELYTAAIDRALVTRLDHAAYLGRELARAEAALRSGGEYVQDGAPERALEAGGSNADSAEMESGCASARRAEPG